MKHIKELVCNYELSFQLKELGISQNTFFFYAIEENGEHGVYVAWDNDIGEKLCSAFTVGELGEMLMDFPYVGIFLTEFNEDGTVDFDIKFSVSENYKLIRERKNLYDKITDYRYHLFDNKKKNYPRSEADARAMFLIFLLKNGVIKLPDKNK